MKDGMQHGMQHGKVCDHALTIVFSRSLTLTGTHSAESTCNLTSALVFTAEHTHTLSASSQLQDSDEKHLRKKKKKKNNMHSL